MFSSWSTRLRPRPPPSPTPNLRLAPPPFTMARQRVEADTMSSLDVSRSSYTSISDSRIRRRQRRKRLYDPSRAGRELERLSELVLVATTASEADEALQEAVAEQHKAEVDAGESMALSSLVHSSLMQANDRLQHHHHHPPANPVLRLPLSIPSLPASAVYYTLLLIFIPCVAYLAAALLACFAASVALLVSAPIPLPVLTPLASLTYHSIAIYNITEHSGEYPEYDLPSAPKAFCEHLNQFTAVFNQERRDKGQCMGVSRECAGDGRRKHRNKDNADDDGDEDRQNRDEEDQVKFYHPEREQVSPAERQLTQWCPLTGITPGCESIMTPYIATILPSAANTSLSEMSDLVRGCSEWSLFMRRREIARVALLKASYQARFDLHNTARAMHIRLNMSSSHTSGVVDKEDEDNPRPRARSADSPQRLIMDLLSQISDLTQIWRHGEWVVPKELRDADEANQLRQERLSSQKHTNMKKTKASYIRKNTKGFGRTSESWWRLRLGSAILLSSTLTNFTIDHASARPGDENALGEPGWPVRRVVSLCDIAAANSMAAKSKASHQKPSQSWFGDRVVQGGGAAVVGPRNLRIEAAGGESERRICVLAYSALETLEQEKSNWRRLVELERKIRDDLRGLDALRCALASVADLYGLQKHHGYGKHKKEEELGHLDSEFGRIAPTEAMSLPEARWMMLKMLPRGDGKGWDHCLDSWVGSHVMSVLSASSSGSFATTDQTEAGQWARTVVRWVRVIPPSARRFFLPRLSSVIRLESERDELVETIARLKEEAWSWRRRFSEEL